MRLLRLSVCALLLSSCGGGGGNPPPGGGGSGPGFRATIDGQAWQADSIGSSAAAVPGVPGSLVIVGAQTSGGVTRGLTLTLYNIASTGTYPLGVSSDVFGGIGLVGEGSGGGGNAQSWITDDTGAAGTITLTNLSGGRIAGTFAFVASPGHSNTVGGTRTVTDGSFDLALTGNLAPVPANVGSKLGARLGGRSYNASSVSGFATSPLGGPGVVISTVNKDHGISITLSDVSAPGTYALDNSGGNARLMSAGRNGGDVEHCCWGGGNTGADVGSVTISSLTADRVKGTFTATLQPVPGKPATAALTVTEGSFDVGFIH